MACVRWKDSRQSDQSLQCALWLTTDSMYALADASLRWAHKVHFSHLRSH